MEEIYKKDQNKKIMDSIMVLCDYDLERVAEFLFNIIVTPVPAPVFYTKHSFLELVKEGRYDEVKNYLIEKFSKMEITKQPVSSGSSQSQA